MSRTCQIVRADLFSVSLPYVTAVEWTTGGVTTHSDYVVARITDEDGRTGAAEVPCRMAWNGMSQAGLMQLFSDVAWPMLSTKNHTPLPRTVRDVGALTALVDNLVDDLEFGRSPSRPSASVGPAIFVITRGAPAEMATVAASAVARGFGAIKLKLGQGLELDRMAIEYVRRSVGDDYPLCADANSAYGRNELPRLLDLAKAHRLTFIEDPCELPAIVSQLAGLQQSPIPIVMDRYCDSALAARQYIELGFNRFAAKPARVGISNAKTMIEVAQEAGGRAVMGLFGESAAGALTQLRLAASVSKAGLIGVEASAHEALTDNFLGFPIRVKDGLYQVPPSLHLASAIDWEKLEALAHVSYSLRNKNGSM